MVMAPEPPTATTTTVVDESALVAADGTAIQGRSLGRIAWTRLKRDKVAMGGGIVALALILMAVFAPLIVHFLGHPPDEFHYKLVDPSLQIPIGKWGGITRHYLFGVEPQNGRDIFSRVVYGSRISLLIAFLATALSVVIGTVMGVIAGYFGGWVDTLISRAMDVFLAAFPAAAVRHRPGRCGTRQGVRADRQRAAHRGTRLHHRLLRLALHRSRRPRPDDSCARGSSSTRPAASAPAPGGSSCANCCPT